MLLDINSKLSYPLSTFSRIGRFRDQRKQFKIRKNYHGV